MAMCLLFAKQLVIIREKANKVYIENIMNMGWSSQPKSDDLLAKETVEQIMRGEIPIHSSRSSNSRRSGATHKQQQLQYFPGNPVASSSSRRARDASLSSHSDSHHLDKVLEVVDNATDGHWASWDIESIGNAASTTTLFGELSQCGDGDNRLMLSCSDTEATVVAATAPFARLNMELYIEPVLPVKVTEHIADVATVDTQKHNEMFNGDFLSLSDDSNHVSTRDSDKEGE